MRDTQLSWRTRITTACLTLRAALIVPILSHMYFLNNSSLCGLWQCVSNFNIKHDYESLEDGSMGIAAGVLPFYKNTKQQANYRGMARLLVHRPQFKWGRLLTTYLKPIQCVPVGFFTTLDSTSIQVRPTMECVCPQIIKGL